MKQRSNLILYTRKVRLKDIVFLLKVKNFKVVLGLESSSPESLLLSLSCTIHYLKSSVYKGAIRY